MFINLNPQHWSIQWSEMLTCPPFYHGENAEQIQNLIQDLALGIEQGDSCMRLAQAPTVLAELCDVIETDECGKLPEMSKLDRNIAPLCWQAPYLYVYRYWQLEYELAQALQRIVTRPVAKVALDEFADLLQDPYQKHALMTGVSQNFAIITGGPGTGKTYVLTRIVAVLKKLNPNMQIAMAAPTGKAAQRMQEALQVAFNDVEFQKKGLYHPDFAHQTTQTLHRLLGIGLQQTPRYDAHNPLPYDVVVVDEASMLDLNLAKMLFTAIGSHTRLILLGDAYQLSSVDVGQVLADLQQVTVLQPYLVQLKHSRRFVDDAMIGRLAKVIYPDLSQQLHAQQRTWADWQTSVQLDLLHTPTQLTEIRTQIQQKQRLDWAGFYPLPSQIDAEKLAEIDPFLIAGYQPYLDALSAYQRNQIDIQQLCQAFDHYRILVAVQYFALGLHRINQLISHHLKQQFQQNTNSEWFFGRAVMMTYNDYQLGLSNGDIGLCIKMNELDLQQQTMTATQDDNSPYVVYFPSLGRFMAVARLPQNMQTAFALTIHKSQGSEFEHVAVILDHQAERLLSRELFYTAVTRAKKMVSLYASESAILHSLNVQSQRQSGLIQQLQLCFAE